jgi:uncharacterized protein YjbJ (UPF0337 family)
VGAPGAGDWSDPAVRTSAEKGEPMKHSIRDKAEGTFHEVKGKLKVEVGKLDDDPKLEAEGRDEEVAGKVQQVVGKIKHIVGR